MLELLQVIPPDRLAAFIAGALVVNVAPGADAIFATASGMAGGPRVGAAAGLGAGAGVCVHVALAALGVAALVAAHPGALAVLRWTGAGYLLWLAWKAWRAGPTVAQGRGSKTALRAFRRGVLTNVMNPKAVLFVLAFLPQFVDPALGPVWRQILLLGGMFAVSGTLVTVLYGVAGGYAGRALARRMGALNRVAAVLFSGLAARLVLD